MIGSLGRSIIGEFVSVVAMEDVFVAVVAVDENDTFFQACFLVAGREIPGVVAARLVAVELIF